MDTEVINSTAASEAIENPDRAEAATVIPAEKPCLLTWKMRLVADGKTLAKNKGDEKLGPFDCPDQVRAFLRRCDERFDSRIADPMTSALRPRFLEKGAGLEAAPNQEVIVKIIYEIKVGMVDGPVHVTKGSLETVLSLAPQSLRGYFGLIERSWQQAIFNPAKAHFRRLVAHRLETLAPTESVEAALKLIYEEIQNLSKQDTKVENELPPVIPDVQVSMRQDGS